MQNLYNKIVSVFFDQSARTKTANKNILIAFLTKGISILISFLIVPITLDYISAEEYGIWMLFASLITWMNLFDIGLGNGLRNKLSESLALNDLKLSKIYISSSFVIISIIAIILFIMLMIIAPFVNWVLFFNTEIIHNNELLKIVIVVVFFFLIDFVFRIQMSILQAFQRYGLCDVINLISQIIGLILVICLVCFAESSLFLLCLVYSIKLPLTMMISSFFLFRNSLKDYRPRWINVDLKRVMPLINLGLKFFLLQICYLIISQSSLFLVAQFFGPKDVTVYNLAFRYMTSVSMIFILVLTPFLTAFTEAYTKKDYDWIKISFKKLNILWFLCSVLIIFLAYFSDLFFTFWIDNRVAIPKDLILVFAVSSILSMKISINTLFLNGISKVGTQTVLLVIEAILFVPLSYLFYKQGFGLISLVLVQILFYCFDTFVYQFQVNKILSKSAFGLWNK